MAEQSNGPKGVGQQIKSAVQSLADTCTMWKATSDIQRVIMRVEQNRKPWLHAPRLSKEQRKALEGSGKPVSPDSHLRRNPWLSAPAPKKTN